MNTGMPVSTASIGRARSMTSGMWTSGFIGPFISAISVGTTACPDLTFESEEGGQAVDQMRTPAVRATVLVVAAAALAACAGNPTSNLDATPTNDLPNPYQSIAPWGKLPAGHDKWGALNGVWVDNDGRSLWV